MRTRKNGRRDKCSHPTVDLFNAPLRDRLINDWIADFDLTNPVSNVRSRTRLTLRRLDSCVLSWNSQTETLNTASPVVKSFTYTVDLRRMKSQGVTVTGGGQLDFSNTTRDAVTSSFVFQVNYRYNGGQENRPSFALLQAPSFPEANALVPLLRSLVNSCQAR